MGTYKGTKKGGGLHRQERYWGSNIAKNLESSGSFSPTITLVKETLMGYKNVKRRFDANQNHSYEGFGQRDEGKTCRSDAEAF